MMEEVRYRPYMGAGRYPEPVNVRRLSENYNTMYADRHLSSQNISWAPPPSLPPKFAVGNARRRDNRMSTASKSNNKPFKLWFNDPEIKRRGRVAKYKLYGAEGKMKMSLKKGYRWIKKKCLEIVCNL